MDYPVLVNPGKPS